MAGPYTSRHSCLILVPGKAANKPFRENTEYFTRKATLSYRADHLFFIFGFIPCLFPILLGTDISYLSEIWKLSLQYSLQDKIPLLNFQWKHFKNYVSCF